MEGSFFEKKEEEEEFHTGAVLVQIVPGRNMQTAWPLVFPKEPLTQSTSQSKINQLFKH